jgi:Lactate racemase N-terminal domain
MVFPPLARVRQSIPQPRLDDVTATIGRLIRGSHLRERVAPGGTIAVGIGSRGVHGIDLVARTIVDTLRDMSYKPFIVAAMGSHGGATSEGQRELLAGYGVTSESMGVAVKTDMDTVVLGTNPVGLPIYFDKNAYQADGIILANRVKPHTDFRATHESGILKMLVIGLGKRDGASQVHKLGVRGLQEVLPAVGRFLVQNTPFALGLAIVENAEDVPAEISALEPEKIFEIEPVLLERARGLMGRLPFDQIDLLVVGELGKNYSGAGMDPNVIGRLFVETQPDFDRPRVTRLVVLDVSDESHGNIVGVGFADLTTDRLVSKMDQQSFRINTLTSCCLQRSRIPLSLPTDQDAIQAGLDTCWRIDPAQARIVVIPNTLELQNLWISRPLDDEVRVHPHLTCETDFQPMPFLEDGSLDQTRLFPASVRGRRGRSGRHADG